MIIGVIFIFVVIFGVLFVIKFPLSSTDLDYVSKKFGNLVGIPFSFRLGVKDLRGYVIFDEVSYLPEFYGNNVIVKAENLFSFLGGNTNSLNFYVYSNSVNFLDISTVAGRLGLDDNEMFEIITNVFDKYLEKVSIQSFSNLLVNGEVKNRDIFYHYSEVFTREWLNLSVKISRLELGISKDVDKIKKDMEEYFNNFRGYAYSVYMDDYSKGYTRVPSEVFVENLEKEVSSLRNVFLKYLSKVDEVYSKLSYLREGYKSAWDMRVEMLKKNPEKYVERYISDFPVYLIKRLISYNFLGLPEVISLKDMYYELVYDGVVRIKGKGKVFSGGEIDFDGTFSNSTLIGRMSLRNLNNDLVKNANISFSGFLYGDSLNGEYECMVDIGKPNRDFIFSVLTNDSFINKVIDELLSEKGFVLVFALQEGDNLFRSYLDQYQRYKVGILRDINKLKEEFRKEVEKSKQKLRKSYLR